MTETTKILKVIDRPPTIPSVLEANGNVVHQPSFGRGRARLSRQSRVKLGWAGTDALETIIMFDDRERVPETHEYPWCLIACLEIRFPAGIGMGTGWLIGGNKVLTAGHCVFDERFGGWATGIRVVPGNDTENPQSLMTEDAPFGEYEAVALQSTKAWITKSDPTRDIAMIHIDHPIGDDLGHFGISIYEDTKDLTNAMVRVAGYPRDRHPTSADGQTLGTVKVAGQLWTHSDRIQKTKKGQIFYTLDTTGGQSGAPVILLGADSLGLIAIGIHNYGFNPAGRVHENKATLINEEIWDHIKGWLAEDF